MESITVADILQVIDNFATFESQEDYDNSCLIAGRESDTVKGVIIAVDATLKVVDEAISKNCNLIICHHPILFSPYKSITDCDYPTSVIIAALENRINIIAAHTNIDLADGGINDRLAVKLLGNNIGKLDFDKYPRIYDLEPMCLYDYANTVGKILNDNTIRIIGSNTEVFKACVVGGSGGSESLVKYCAINGIVLLTADVKQNIAAMADDIGAKLIVFGHFTSEKIFVTIIEELLIESFGTLIIAESIKNDNPYRLRVEDKE